MSLLRAKSALENDIRKWKLENLPVSGVPDCKPVLRSENVNFGFRNDVIGMTSHLNFLASYLHFPAVLGRILPSNLAPGNCLIKFYVEFFCRRHSVHIRSSRLALAQI